jgi:cytochrome c oxidase cbb3-type subunit 4
VSEAVDINTLRVLVTVLLFAVFIGIVAWVVAPRNKRRFDAAQQLPFTDEMSAASRAAERKHDE